MKIFFTFILVTFVSFHTNAQDVEEPDFELLDNIAVKDSIYSVYVKSENETFTLKICNVDTCAITQEYIKTIPPNLLTTDLFAVIKNNFDDEATMSTEQKEYIDTLIDKLEASDLSNLKASKTELENTLYSIDNEKDQYSAKIVLNNDIPCIIKSYSENTKTTINNKTLKIIDAKVQFFNNKASSIYIKAELTIDSITETLIFLNNRFSVPIRSFNNYGSSVSTRNKHRDHVIIDYNDVFDYESDQFFNYSVSNSQISLSNVEPDKSSAKIIQRRFFDFFTGIIYSDVMGFNTENSNSLLNAQAKLLLPLNLRNYGKLTFTRQFSTTANIALNSSFEDESRFISIRDNETFSNFDLLKKNNLYGKFSLDVLTYESKGWFLNTSLGYSAAFYRTGFRYAQTQLTEEDIVTNTQLMSIAHGPYLNFEIRPQTNFGADVFISLEDLNYNDIKTINNRSFNNDIMTYNGNKHFISKYNLVNVEANFYWLIDPEKSNGGIYAKLGSYYHTENHSVFPQIMVGYATNLTSFVNRFKPNNVEQVIDTE